MDLNSAFFSLVCSQTCPTPCQQHSLLLARGHGFIRLFFSSLCWAQPDCPLEDTCSVIQAQSNSKNRNALFIILFFKCLSLPKIVVPPCYQGLKDSRAVADQIISFQEKQGKGNYVLLMDWGEVGGGGNVNKANAEAVTLTKQSLWLLAGSGIL